VKLPVGSELAGRTPILFVVMLSEVEASLAFSEAVRPRG
jgi:hypothetical protein